MNKNQTSKNILTVDDLPEVPASTNRGVLKADYNHRTRSLARTFVNLFDCENVKKKLRVQMRDFTNFAEIRDHALKIISREEWDTLIENWFNASNKD